MSDAVVIGAGFGGLLCGKILSRRGFHVTILERGTQPGGALRTFVRDGVRFDTGFHSVGGREPGGPLAAILRSIGVDGLPWIAMEPDEIVGGTDPFLRLSTGWEEEQEHVLEPYRQGVWRLAGGGKTLVDALAAGQEILLQKEVTALEDHTAVCSDGSCYRGDVIVSDIHPQITLQLLHDPVRPVYRKRIERMENGPGILTVNAKLRPETLQYINHSIFLDDEVMIHFGEPDDCGFARSLDLMKFAEMPGQAGNDAQKQAEKMIRKAAERLPGLPEAIEQYWISTPQTWERYTGTPGGTAYGLRKHDRQDYIAPQTPLPWLYLTGQNLGLHGLLGTAVTALNTCKAIAL